jgi:hypothetical protein
VKDIRCGECGTQFEGSDKTKCPHCGSTKKTSSPATFDVEVKDGFHLGDKVGGVHEAHMSVESWTIFGLILGFIIPPTFYAVFSILTFCFWYKLLIWLGVIIIAFYLTRSYNVIKFLRVIADKAYGRHKL